MRLTIRNGHIIDPANQIDTVSDLHIADGLIVALGTPPDGFNAEQQIDASGLIVAPGLVDLSARLREPGQEHKANIASETHAAAAAGITTLACPPDTDPVIDTPAVVELIRHRAGATGMSRVVCIGAATQGLRGEHLSEMGALKQADCAGIGNALYAVSTPLVMRRIMEYAATHDLTLHLFSEDPSLRNGGCIHEGAVSTRLGLPGIPEAAETVAVARDLALITATGVRAHFCRLSTARAVQMVARARHDGLAITADVTAHHLHLTDMDVGYFDSQCHMRPPLRNQRDLQALRKGVASGVIDAICSDHQPHEADAKLTPFTESASGISALETLLPLALRLVDEGAMTLPQLIATITVKPAQILGLDAGTLTPGANADISIFDPEHYWRLSSEALRSRGHNTPFIGWELKGKVKQTLLSGRIIYTA